MWLHILIAKLINNCMFLQLLHTKPATILATFSLYIADVKKSSHQDGGWQGVIGTPETPHNPALFNP